MIRVRRLVLAAAIVTTAISPLLNAAEPEPCAESIHGAFLISSVGDIARTTSLLRLLNGSEPPKLRSVLQLNLLQSVFTAARHLEPGKAALRSLPPATSLLEGLDRASAYVAENGLDRSALPARAPDDPDILPSVALQQVRAAIKAAAK